MLMSEIRGIVNQIVEESRTRPGGKYHFHNIHLLLCGDLNSLPESGEFLFIFLSLQRIWRSPRKSGLTPKTVEANE